MRTRAAVSTGPGVPFRLTELDLDDPRPDELLVRVEAVGLCHTDLVVQGMWPAGSPIVLGHEGAGVVQQVGDAVTDVRPGDRVLLSFASCGACPGCRAGRPAYCDRFPDANFSGRRLDGSATLTGPDGPVAASFFGQSSFARHALTPRRNAVLVGPDVDLTLAAPFGCGVQTGAGSVLNVLRPGPEDSLLVVGLGGVGTAAVMAAGILGVRQVVGVDPVGSRRDLARALGATDVLDGADPDLLDRLREVTGGGASHALDSTGVPAATRTAAQALRARGTLVVVGVGPDVTLDAADLLAGGKTVRGSIEGDVDPQAFIPRLVEWYRAGRLPMQQVVRTFPLAEIDAAVAAMHDGSVVKPVLLPGD